MAHTDRKRRKPATRTVNRLYTDTLVKAERLDRLALSITDHELSLAYRERAREERAKLEFIPQYATSEKFASADLTKAEGELERLEQLSASVDDRELGRGYAELAKQQRRRVASIREALE